MHARPLERTMASQPIEVDEPVRFSEGYEFDVRARRLRRGRHLIRLERIPLEILALLVERRDAIVSRDEIVSRVWGKGVFLDTDNSIRGAIRKLRQALRDDAGNPRFIQTVTGQGYRFIAPVLCTEAGRRTETAEPGTSASSMSEPDPGFGLEPSPPAAQRAARRATAEQTAGHIRRWPIAGAVFLLAIAGSVAYEFTRSRAQGPTHPKISSLAVLPLKNLSGDPAQEYLADGMTEELTGRVSMIHSLRVISRTSVMQFKNSTLLTPEIAKALGVDTLVEGSVIREGNRIRVHAQLIRASTDEHFWSETYDRDFSDVLALQSSVAQAIAEKIEVSLSDEERSRLVAVRHVSPEVYESYLKGRYSDDAGRSLPYYESAIQKDPTFAPAYVGLAYANFILGTPAGGAPPQSVRSKAILAAQKALELDPTLAEPHVILALTYQEQWEWSSAQHEYEAALNLSPNDAWVHGNYGRWMLCQGRFDEAQALARRGRDLDPLTVGGQDLGWILFQSRRYDEAVRELRSDLAVHPDNAGDMWFLGFSLIGKGASDEAVPVLERAVSLSNRSPAIIGVLVHAYADVGRRAEAIALVDELKRRQRQGYIPAAAFVHAYLGLGDKEQAFAWMERAFQERSSILQYLKVHPFFDPVRADARFQNLMLRVGLK
jgi:TolB-like protein/DNA-binding winged helix-turn-helix (wHTH) protein/Flp pilus assembly protein TadD